MTNRPISIPAALIFILLNFLVWLVFGIIIASNVHPALPDQPFIKWTMAILAFITAGILLVLFIFLRKRSQRAYFLTLALFFTISTLTIFDQFGWADLAVLTINIIPILLLIKDRAWYLQTGSRPAGR